LVVDQTVPLNAVTQPDKLLAHLLEPFLRNEALGALKLLARFHHFFLPLEHGQPRVVEVVPQLYPVTVQVLVVRREA
jgi:hypothetical protein